MYGKELYSLDISVAVVKLQLLAPMRVELGVQGQFLNFLCHLHFLLLLCLLEREIFTAYS